ncbi:biotin transporter BioY [Curvibacter sp. CHRR-16]|uniref:biotin transporter BioY n=1 Tax=Curvibacter sp. CHRR-16 TaxID=2835872 RepID=UPI001BDAEE88|nr:biotin transporter BioY [Curvibacter sp. CHRR-16]MBT0569609.1 biotin transporter BioY [Curvibacter sp. CHRR-16]
MTKNTRETTVYVALFAALMAVLGLIPKIDLAFGVPITLQTMGVMMAGCLLGPRRGALSMLLFLLAVAAGLPLLSGGRGGIGVFFGPSGGYLICWPVAAAICGWLMQRLLALKTPATPRSIALSAWVASVVGGIVVIHIFGVIGLVFLVKLDWSKAALGTLAFVPGDLIKSVVCALVVQTVAKGLPDWNFGRQAS